MDKHYEEKVIFEKVENVSNYDKYGFKLVEDGIIFSAYFVKTKSDLWKLFLLNNFHDIAKCYWIAMKFDSCKEKSRSRRLTSFLKYIWEQDEIDAALIMIKSVLYLYDRDLEEQEIIGEIITRILPNAGYSKKLVDGIYVWNTHNRKNFGGIGNIFVLAYITNGFDRDATWKWIKKNCYLKDEIWHYKSNVAKKQINEILKNHIANGGIIVEQINKEFNAFIPFSVLEKDATGSSRVIKKSADGKEYLIEGVASTTNIDLDEERISKNFIKSMKKQAIGLPLKVVSHKDQGDLNQTVGVITGKSGNEDTFYVEGKLQPPSDNGNVDKLVKQMDFGIQYGFSIFGIVTKIFRQFDEKLKKEIVVLDDGRLSHILITDQPANKDTFAQAVIKSLDPSNQRRIVNQFKHSSNVHKDEIESDKIEVGTLPDQAFPINYTTGEIYKDYPHHYISVDNGELYLHKEMTVISFFAAKKNNAPPIVLEHLRNHLVVIGANQEVKRFEEMVSKVDNLEDLKGKIGIIIAHLKKFNSDIRVIASNKSDMKAKMSEITPKIDEVAIKIAEILNNLEVEE